MSGGYFEYKNLCLRDMADELNTLCQQLNAKKNGQTVIEYNDYLEQQEEVYVPDVSEQAQHLLEQTVKDLLVLEHRLHLIDYFLSADTSEQPMIDKWNDTPE